MNILESRIRKRISCDQSRNQFAHKKQPSSCSPPSGQLSPYFQSEINCNVCFDSIGTFGVVNCGHLFCFDCIHSWSAETNSCPICRKKFGVIKRVSSAESEFVKVQIKGKEEKLEDFDPIFFGEMRSQRTFLCLQADE